MTATLLTTTEILEPDGTADFRLSSRQRDLLRTLNTLFDELVPTRIEVVGEEELFGLPKTLFDTRNVSRVVRD